jgi:hypothetical protein
MRLRASLRGYGQRGDLRRFQLIRQIPATDGGDDHDWFQQGSDPIFDLGRRALQIVLGKL